VVSFKRYYSPTETPYEETRGDIKATLGIVPERFDALQPAGAVDERSSSGISRASGRFR
jgi:hypothetical protein